MKNLLVILLMLISGISFGQIALPVYYSIPPTGAGCNGQVAIDSRLLNGSACPTPFSYNSDCNSNILTTMVFAQDTIFINNVCQLPCSLYVVSPLGSCAYCFIDIQSGIESDISRSSMIFNQGNNSIDLKNLPAGKYNFSIMDLTGRVILKDNLLIERSFVQEHFPNLKSGIYLYSISGTAFQKTGRAIVQ